MEKKEDPNDQKFMSSDTMSRFAENEEREEEVEEKFTHELFSMLEYKDKPSI